MRCGGSACAALDYSTLVEGSFFAKYLRWENVPLQCDADEADSCGDHGSCIGLERVYTLQVI